MATIRVLLGIVCLVFTGGHCLCSSRILGSRGLEVQSQQIWCIKKARCFSVENVVPFVVKNNDCRKPSHHFKSAVISIAQSQIGVREATGHNDGRQVEAYLRYTGLKKGNPWCAAFVSWVFGQAGYRQPVTAWSPALFPAGRRTTDIKPATLFGVYFPALKRIAHCGLVAQKDGHWFISIEGNTNVDGSREGDGVYRKRRLVKSIHLFADWTKQKGGNHAHE